MAVFNIEQRLRRIRNRVLILSAFSFLSITGLLIYVPLDEKVQAQGYTRARKETYVRAPANGTIAELFVYGSETVKKGTPLLRLDTTDAEALLQTLEARLTKAKADLTLKEKKLTTVEKLPLPKEYRHSREDYEAAEKRKEQTEIDLKRLDELGNTGAVSQHFVETARLAVALSKAEFEKAERNLKLVDAGLEKTILEEAQAEVEAARQEVAILEVERQTLEKEIARHTIRAPEDGIVTLVLKRTQGESVEKGDDLVHVAHGETMQVHLFASEREYPRIKAGQRVMMTTPTFNRIRYGYIEGEILYKSMEPERITSSPNREESVKGYRVVVEITQTPQPLPLGAGIEGDIVLQRAPLWRFLLPQG